MQVFATGKATAFGRALYQLTCFFPKSRQAVRVMKLTTILLLAACLQLSAKGISQTVSITVKDVPLLTVLKEIKKQTGYFYLADNEWLQKAKKVTLSAINWPLLKVLDECFKGQPLTYNIEGKVINIIPKEEKPKGVSVVNDVPPIDVRGRVVNENGEPVVSASVTVKGTSRGTTTNENGEFYLPGLDKNATLVISGINISTTQIKVNGLTSLAINVKSTITPLEETIIKGYYTTTRKLNTGSVSKVSAESISKEPISNPLEAIEGRMPGVFIQQTTGLAGGGINIQIRGQNSLRTRQGNNGNLPLYIIDGVPYSSTPMNSIYTSTIIQNGSPLSNINPYDIESIEVLKDADATAIYGSRGANGVVLITTKKGKQGKTKLDINTYTGVMKVAHTMKLLNTDQYLEMRHEAFKNDNATPQAVDYDINGSWDTTVYNDWQKILIGRTAHLTDAQVSLSGGSNTTQFLLGSGYQKQTTVFPDDFKDEKYSTHFNLTHASTDKKVTVNFTGSYVYDNNKLPYTNPTYAAITLSPIAPPIYDNNGNLNWGPGNFSNPFGELRKLYKINASNLISNSVIGYRIIKNLQLKASLGYNQTNLDEIVTFPISANLPSLGITKGNATFANGKIRSWIIEPQAEYKVDLSNNKISILVGTTFQENISQSITYNAQGYATDALLENIAAAPTLSIYGSNYAQYRYSALFGRINYQWKEKYLLNITGRRDGSSRFGPSKRFANFGSVGAAWIFSNENFLIHNAHFLNYGKLRFSYGTTGSDQLQDYAYLDTYSPTQYPFEGTSALYPTRLANPSYSWETNKKMEFGLEMSFFHDRLSAVASYYRNRSSSQLVGLPLPAITGFTSIQSNFPALVENNGWEFELNTNNIRNKDFTWSTAINVTSPRNKLISYPNISGSSFANLYEIGKSLYIQKAIHTIGVNESTGIYMFEDYDRNGAISYPGDLQALKDLSQRIYGGMQNNIRFKNFELGFLFQFVKQNGLFPGIFSMPGTRGNQPASVMNRWRKQGDVTDVQKFSQNFASPVYTAYSQRQTFSDSKIVDASFIRLKNAFISYELPQHLKDKIHLSQCKVFVQGQNIITITNYTGLDPETQGYAFPPLRIITAGINISL
jgi:TonB-linked SusC/RagA family outer membrane protein